MDFVDKPTGVSDPGFSMEPLVTEEESKADMDRAKEEMEEMETSTNSMSAKNRFVNPLTDEIEETDPVGDDREGMGFMDFLEQEQDEQADLPPLF